MSKFLTLSLIVCLLAACAPKGNSAPFSLVPPDETTPSDSGTPSGNLPTTGSGVKGQALIGPACPVMRIDSPCPDQPYQTTLTVLTLDGQEVARIETDAEGRFTVNLAPGEYVLHPEKPAGHPLPTAPDVPFTVLPNEFTNIVVTYDSGIR